MRQQRTALSGLVVGFSWMVLATALAAAPAHAMSFGVGSGGVDVARGCDGVGCLNPEIFSLVGGLAPATGTVELAATLGFSLEVNALQLSGGPDDGVSTVDFTKLSYSATGLSLMDLGGGMLVAMPGQTVSVTAEVDAGVVTVIARDVALTSGVCMVVGGNATCGFTFGSSGFDVPVGTTSPTDRYFEHTLDLGLQQVPEPTTAVLVLTGLLGLALAGGRGRQG